MVTNAREARTQQVRLVSLSLVNMRDDKDAAFGDAAGRVGDPLPPSCFCLSGEIRCVGGTTMVMHAL